MQVWTDLIRIVLAMSLLYGLLPVLAVKAGDKWGGHWSTLLVPATLRTALLIEVAVIVLGNSRICFPGITFSIYAVWLGVTVMFASRRRWVYDRKAWEWGYGAVWRWIERHGNPWKMFAGVISVSQTALLLGLVLIGGAVQFLWYPMNNYRLLGIQTYARVFSLQTLVAGNDWYADGSIALLAPVVFLSGLDAATVIRLSAPIFYVLLMGAVAWCAFEYSRALWCSIFAAGIFWMYTRVIGLESVGELGSAEIGAVFLVLAAALMCRSPGYAACAAVLAWMVEPLFHSILLAALLCIFAALVAYWCFVRTPRLARQIVASGFLLLLGLSLNSALRSAPADGPYEYEASARMAAKIAREYPRNRWVLVSPVYEAAYSYGRGWHVELSDFVTKFTPARVARPEFDFPYEAAHIFVFVEKRPLAQVARSTHPGSSGSSFFYSTKSGRASLEFQAARVMAAYSSSHSNVGVFFEDDDLIVYRITK